MGADTVMVSSPRVMLVTSGYAWPHTALEESIGRALAQRRVASGVFELARVLEPAARTKIAQGALTPADDAAHRLLSALDAAVSAHAPDVALVFHGRLFPRFAVERLRERGVFPVLWACEDPYELDWTLDGAPAYGAVGTIEASCVGEYRRAGTEAFHLPLGYDPYLFRPRDVPAGYLSDVCVLGSAFPRRIEVLTELAPALARLDVRIVGRWWDALPRELHRFVEDRIVEPGEAALFYAGATLTLNVHRDSVEASFSNRGGVVGRSVNNRTFEIAGAGGFQVVDAERDERAGLSGTAVGTLTPDVLDLLADPAALRERGRAAAREAAASHTYAHRVDALTRELARLEVEPLRSSVAVPAAPPEAPAGLTSIVILTRNQLPYTRLCVDSIRRHTREPYELVMVDNGSDDGTVEYLRSLEGATVIENPGNLGFAIGCNQGALRARGDVVVFLNNDTVVTPGWLRRTRDLLAADPARGAVGPRSNSIVGPQLLLPVPYTPDLEGLDAFAEERAAALAGSGREVERLIGFCLAVKREAIDRVGGFDPRFGTGNFEDDDLCLRLRIAGYTLWLADDVFVHHFGSRTFAGEGIDYARLMGTNWQAFARKWALSAAELASFGYDGGKLRAHAGAFDPARHAVPLTAGWLADLDVDATRSSKLLLPFDPARDDWEPALLAFADAFASDADVSLVAYAPHADTAAAAERLTAALGERADDVAEVVLLDGRCDADALVWAVDGCLSSPGAADVLERARRSGLRLLDADPAALRAAVTA